MHLIAELDFLIKKVDTEIVFIIDRTLIKDLKENYILNKKLLTLQEKETIGFIYDYYNYYH